MQVYRGVVKGKTVVLDEPIDLPDGTVVEVQPVYPPPATPEEQAQEEAFSQYLLEIGLIKRIPTRKPDPPGIDRTPIQITGRPLSEWIIEERR